MSDASVSKYIEAAIAAELPALFREIFERELVYPVFQPIVDVRNKCIFGYEALIRGPQGSRLVSPYDLFRCAGMLSLGDEFEVLCRKVSIRQFARSGLPHRLFLNTSPALLIAGDFEKGKTLEFLHESRLDPQRVVIEVTEHQQTSKYEILNEALQQYRALGFQVALDDLGAGYSSLRLWKEVQPDYIKVDKHFIRDIHTNKLKQTFVNGLLEISTGSNCRLIAEGIEKRGEFEYLASHGITLMQGFYFAQPATKPDVTIEPELLKVSPKAEPVQIRIQDDLPAIARMIQPIPFGMKVKDVLEKLQKDPDLDLIPVVNSSRPVGLVERYSFLNKIMKSIYGVELYGKLRIVDFLEQAPVIVDVNSSLDIASRKVTSHANRVHGFIVTENDRYYGVSTVLDLLHKITQQQIDSARHANPLTLLPGIVPTNQTIDTLLSANSSFALIYFDLDNFKPYNDQYGYEAGDNVIKRLAEVLCKVYDKHHSAIGHIGGDDFVVVDRLPNVIERCEQVFELFAREISTFYSPEHVRAGGISGMDRQNRPCFFNLLSISAGIVPQDSTRTCQSHIEVADFASEAKKQAKKREGNAFFINRRTSGS